MADEDINPVVLLADPKVNHRVWAACLKWSPVVKKQRVPSHQKHKPHVSRIVAMSFCEPRSCLGWLSS